jgi:hypothetical protein
MTPDIFFRRHSFTFRILIARFYPLNKELITVFKPCFDDYYLARNPNISEDFLIELAIKKIDNWQYLNKDVPLESVSVYTFLEQGTSPVAYLDNKMMSDELTAENLAFLLDKGYVFKYLGLKPHHVKWTFELYNLLYKTKNGLDYLLTIDNFGHYYVYKNLIEPYVNDALIQDILSKKYQAEISQNNLKYYHIQQGDIKEMIDVYVRNIEVLYWEKKSESNEKLENSTALNTVPFWEENGRWENLTGTPPSELIIEGELTNNYSTTPVLADFVKIRNEKWAISLCFSERVKKVLEQFNLPPHRFTPIICTWDKRTQKKFKITESFVYYAFMMDSSELWRNLDYTASTFVTLQTPQYNQGFVNDFIVDKHLILKNYEEFKTQRGQIAHWLDIICTKYVSPQNWDVIGFDYVFLINEDVKNALEKLKPISMKFINEIDFKKQKALHFHLLGAETKEHRQRNFNIIQSIENQLIEDNSKAKIDALKAQQQAKIDRLEANTEEVKNYYLAKNDSDIISEKESVIRAKEIELNALFPKAFREKLLTNKIPKTMRKHYEMLALEAIFSVGSGDDGWQIYSPEAINAVAIGANDCGDYIGFLLKENSDVQLDAQLVLFNHESATVEDI